MKMKKYVVSEVSSKHKTPDSPKHLWYVHSDGYPDIPVFGSFGTKKYAQSVCDIMNLKGVTHNA